MNFSVSEGIGLIGGWVLFGGLMLAFTVVVTIIIRVVRGRNAGGDLPPGQAPEDDYVI